MINFDKSEASRPTSQHRIREDFRFQRYFCESSKLKSPCVLDRRNKFRLVLAVVNIGCLPLISRTRGNSQVSHTLYLDGMWMKSIRNVTTRHYIR